MSFLEPLAFVFAAAIPVVIVFYLLKRRRTVRLVSSTLLWQKFLAETQANAPFQRLRNNWLLLLQLLVLLLVILAVARPIFRGTQRPGAFRVLVLDASASMLSTDVAPNRFEVARQEALKWIDGLRDGERMVVLTAGANAEVRQSATDDKALLRRAVQAARPTEAPTRLLDALKLARTLAESQGGVTAAAPPEIHLFSDGALPALPEFANENLPLVYHKIGVRGHNAGLVRLDVRANPDNPAQRAVFAAVTNPGTNELAGTVDLLLDGRNVETRNLTLPPTNTVPLVFVADQPRDGVFTVRLNVSDDLAADNEARVVSLLPHPIQVLLVTRGNVYLERALRATPNVVLTIAGTLPSAPQPPPDIVVLDDITPPSPPRANLLAIHVTDPQWFTETTAVKDPPVLDWKRNHPVLRHVNFDNVELLEAYGVKGATWGVTLVESPNTPLMLAGELGNQRLIWVGFDVLKSTWPLRLSFPIFIGNAVEWLNPAAVNAAQYVVPTGQPFRLPLNSPVTEARVTRPDSTSVAVTLGANAREVVFADTALHGQYRLQAGSNDVTFVVNLMDPAESDTMPREELPFGKYTVGAAGKARQANVETWRWLALAGLGLLLFEWWYYHKRTV